MVEEEEELLPYTTFGHYVIHRRIGAGGMGDVYAAEHSALGKRVAIKVMRRDLLDDETFVARFLREGKLAGRLRHPNLVDVTDVGVIDGVPCLVMELLEGESFVDKIRREGALPTEEVVDIALPIIAALDHAHGEGILHRDMKPGNVFLARAWNGELVPKLLDFGISKVVGESATSALTNDTRILGTPRYVAPELMGGEKATVRSDLYGMGLVLYEACTGVKPFADAGANLASVIRAVGCGNCKKPRELCPDIPETLERVVHRTMAVLPADRYGSMRELGAALLPLASPRVRTIWEPLFEGADPLNVTGETGLLGIAAPTDADTDTDDAGAPPATTGGSMSLVGVTVAADPESTEGTLLLSSPLHRADNETVVMARPPTAHNVTLRAPGGAAPNTTAAHALLGLIASQPKLLRAAVIAGLAAFIGIAFLALAIVRRGSSRPAAAPSATASALAPAPAPSPPEATFEVGLEVVPSTAAIELDGRAAGVGAFRRSLPRDGREHVLHLVAVGYEPVTMVFDETRPPPARIVLRAVSEPDSDSEPEIDLDPEPEPARAPQKARSRSGTPRGAQSATRPGSRTDNINPWE